MSTQPLTEKEIIDIIMRAVDKKGDLHARISLTAGIEIDTVTKQVKAKSYYPKIVIDVPPDKPVILDAFHQLQATLNTLHGEFMAANLLKIPNVVNAQTTAKTEPQINWITSEKNPALEFIPADTPGAQMFLEWARNKQHGYWLFNTGKGELIFRYKKAA